MLIYDVDIDEIIIVLWCWKMMSQILFVMMSNDEKYLVYNDE